MMQDFFTTQWTALLSWWQDNWIRVLLIIILILVCFIIAKVVSTYGGRMLKRLVSRMGNRGRTVDERKARTLATLLTSVFRFLVWGIAFVIVLSLLGLNQVATTILATAGISSIAIGFGAQNLIRDFLSGVFLISDNLLSVGDLVTVAGVTGTVEAIKLRSTGIRSNSGELHIIPNGAISAVVNYTHGNGLAIVDLLLPNTLPYIEIEDTLITSLDQFVEREKMALEPPQLLGVVGVHVPSEYIVRTICRVRPMRRLDVERALRDIQLKALQEQGVPVRSDPDANHV